MPLGSPSSTARRGREVPALLCGSVDTDVRCLDELAEALVFVLVELRELLDRELAGLAAETFESLLDIGQRQRLHELRVEQIDNRPRCAPRDEQAVPRCHFGRRITGF